MSGLTTFVAIFRGQSVDEAQLVAVTTDPAICGYVARKLLRQKARPKADAALDALERGERLALQHIANEASQVGEVS